MNFKPAPRRLFLLVLAALWAVVAFVDRDVRPPKEARPGPDSPEARALWNKAKTTTVDLAVSGESLRDVVASLAKRTGIDISIDSRIGGAVGDERVPQIQVEGISLVEALRMLEAVPKESDLTWTASDSLVLTRREYVRQRVETRSYDVTDLVEGLADFNPPRPDLVSGDTVGGEDVWGGRETVPARPFDGVDHLIELVKSAVGQPETWAEPDSSISVSGRSVLVVRHTSAVHEWVAKFLSDLRELAAGGARGVEAR